MTLVAVAVFGLLCGSFANVLIARVPTGEQWLRGSSRCPRCAHGIAWYDNVPVVSWIVLRARCRHCREPISWLYPLVELAVAALWVLSAWIFGLSATFAALAYLAVVTVALVFIDIDVKRLPDQLVLPSYPILAVVLVVATAIDGHWWLLARAAIGMAVMGGYYGLLRLLWPRGMGAGDVKTAGLLGMMAGFLGWGPLAVAVIAGPLVGGLAIVVPLLTRRLGMRSKVPYGPALIAGAWIGYLAGAPLASGYVSIFV